MYVCVCGNREHYIYFHAECFLRKCIIFTIGALTCLGNSQDTSLE